MPSLKYRFDTVPAGATWPSSKAHSDEFAFVFGDSNGKITLGIGFAPSEVLNFLAGTGYSTDPFAGEPQSHKEFSNLMSKSWASFVYDLDANTWAERSTAVPRSPSYNLSAPKNIVFDANITSHIEDDTFKKRPALG